MELSPEQVTRALDRILESPLFAKADRQRRFLRYIVERKQARDEASLREFAIGLAVYDRPSSYDPKTDPIVRVEAARLRGRLREYYETADADDPLLIRLPKGSYVPAIEWRISPPAAAEPATPFIDQPPLPIEPAPIEPVPSALHRRPWAAAAACAGVLAVGLLCANWYKPSRHAVRPIESIAVMPFADLSEKKDLAYLAAGLTEQIQEEFGRIRNLRVIGSASTRQVSDNPDLRAAARRMGAGALLEGSIRAEQQKVRTTVRLYDGENGGVIWSGTFDGDRTDLFALEDKIAQSIAGKLEIQLAERREGIDARTDPRRAQAYEFVERARVLLRRDSSAPDALEVPYGLLQQAVAMDPGYGAAHAALAGILVQSSGTLAGSDGKAKTLAEVHRAMELDPGLPAAQVALILYYRDVENNWKEARKICTGALQRLPNAAGILDACSTVEGDLRENANEVELARRAVLVDPLAGRTHAGLMMTLYRAGKFDEALSEADTAIGMGLRNSCFIRRHQALILAAKGDLPAALKTIDEARAELGGDAANWMGVRGYILARMGNRREAEQFIREYDRRGSNDHSKALLYLGLGERSQAMNQLEKAFETNPTALAHTIPQYYARELDGDPRFEALRKKLGVKLD